MKKIIATLLLACVMATSCYEGDKATQKDQETASQQLTQFLESQPVPVFPSSQLRQNLIDIQTAQANATVTTSFFFNLGVRDPIHSCPSVGFPIPGTFQLTNPEGVVAVRKGGEFGIYELPQLESTGVYTGDTPGTTVICIDEAGRGYAHWWEGSVSTVAGPATWDGGSGQVKMTGKPTAEFDTGEK